MTRKSTPLSPEVSNIASTIENIMLLKKHWVTILADMEKGLDTRTLSAEIFNNCGNFWIVED